MYAILGVLPIVLAVVLMVYFSIKSGKAMAAAWILGFVLAAAFWKMNLTHIIAYTIYGFLASIDTIIIVIGAIFLLNVLIELKFIESIGNGFGDITQDRRIQILIIGWLFGCFIEGAAGFGTPGALAAPLLVGLGVPPFAASMASLIGNSTPTTFGAVGTPPLTGFYTILPSIQQTFPALDPAVFAAQFFSMMGLANILIGSFVPFLIVASVVARDGKQNGIKDAISIFPLCLFSGLVFTIPVYFIVTYIGPEIPSLLGALIGLVIMISAVKKGFLVPAEVYRFPNDPIIKVTKENKSDVPLLTAWSPYIVIAIVLVVSRLPWLPVKAWIGESSRALTITNILGFQGIDWSWRFFSNPGLFPFIIVAVIYMLVMGMNAEVAKAVVKTTFNQVKNAAIALLFGVALVQLMRYTNYSNPTGELGPMTTEVAKALAAIFGGMYPLISPLVGVFGAFISGSNTVSNVMFMSLQFEAALLVGLPTVMIAVSQSTGGAIGCMVCIHNIVALTATTNAVGKEGKLLAATVLPCLIYSLLLSALLFICLALGINWVA